MVDIGSAGAANAGASLPTPELRFQRRSFASNAGASLPTPELRFQAFPDELTGWGMSDAEAAVAGRPAMGPEDQRDNKSRQPIVQINRDNQSSRSIVQINRPDQSSRSIVQINRPDQSSRSIETTNRSIANRPDPSSRSIANRPDQLPWRMSFAVLGCEQPTASRTPTRRTHRGLPRAWKPRSVRLDSES